MPAVAYHNTTAVLTATDYASTTTWNLNTSGVTDRTQHFSVQAVYANAAPAAGTFTAAVTDICTKAAHGYKTGLKVQLTTTTTLPAGLSLATDYFVIYLTADTFSLASSLALAVAGTAVDITDTGTGTHTITPTTSTGNILKLQASNVPSPSTSTTSTEWTDVTSATVTIATTAGSVMWVVGARPCRHYRIMYTPSAGQITLGIYVAAEVIG